MAFTPLPPRQPGDKPIERAVAIKLWIRELLSGEMEVTEGLQPNSLKTARASVKRVNVIGVIVDSAELPVSTITLDDGTGQVQVRSFDKAIMSSVGSFVQVIGRPRAYQGNLYIAAEMVAPIPSSWAAFRKTELGEVMAVTRAVEAPRVIAEEAPIGEVPAEKILRVIAEFDKGDGAPVEQVIAMSGIKNAEQIIDQMLRQGDIFELRPGKVKVL